MYITHVFVTHVFVYVTKVTESIVIPPTILRLQLRLRNSSTRL